MMEERGKEEPILVDNRNSNALSRTSVFEKSKRASDMEEYHLKTIEFKTIITIDYVIKL